MYSSRVTISLETDYSYNLQYGKKYLEQRLSVFQFQLFYHIAENINQGNESVNVFDWPRTYEIE